MLETARYEKSARQPFPLIYGHSGLDWSHLELKKPDPRGATQLSSWRASPPRHLLRAEPWVGLPHGLSVRLGPWCVYEPQLQATGGSQGAGRRSQHPRASEGCLVLRKV